MGERKPIVVVGSINMDLVATAERIPTPGETLMGSQFEMYPGGKGANQAVAAGRLGYPVELIGRLGNDALAGKLRSHLREAGVGLEGVASSDGPSGVALIVVSAAGENSIVVTPGANALLTAEDLDRNIHLIRSASMVLAQLEVPLETVCHLADLCMREKVPLMLDPAPPCRLPPRLLRAVSWFTPNQAEALFFLAGRSAASHEERAETLRSDGPAGVVLKLGGQGTYFGTRHEGQFVPPFEVTAVDTTAAGDAFNGAFAVALCEGLQPGEAVRFAAAAAAIAVTRRGAQAAMPWRHEVQRLLASEYKR